MKKYIFGLIVLSLVVLSQPKDARAAAQLINLQFSGQDVQGGAAKIGSVGDFWNQTNNLGKTVWNLKNSSDLSSGVSVSWGTPNDFAKGSLINPEDNAFSTPVTKQDELLMSGFFTSKATGVGTTVMTFSGLVAGNYDLYIYSQDQKGKSSNLSFVANGVSGSAYLEQTLQLL